MYSYSFGAIHKLRNACEEGGGVNYSFTRRYKRSPSIRNVRSFTNVKLKKWQVKIEELHGRQNGKTGNTSAHFPSDKILISATVQKCFKCLKRSHISFSTEWDGTIHSPPGAIRPWLLKAFPKWLSMPKYSQKNVLGASKGDLSGTALGRDRLKWGAMVRNTKHWSMSP